MSDKRTDNKNGRSAAYQTYLLRQTARAHGISLRRARRSVDPAKTKVLIVEDDPFQRMAVAEQLEEYGWTVIDAFSASEALDILKDDSHIGAVITDVHMAGDLDGLDLARLCNDIWPHIVLVITSGIVAIEDDELPSGAMFLSKPLDPRRLAEAIGVRKD